MDRFEECVEIVDMDAGSHGAFRPGDECVRCVCVSVACVWCSGGPLCCIGSGGQWCTGALVAGAGLRAVSSSVVSAWSVLAVSMEGPLCRDRSCALRGLSNRPASLSGRECARGNLS